MDKELNCHRAGGQEEHDLADTFDPNIPAVKIENLLMQEKLMTVYRLGFLKVTPPEEMYLLHILSFTVMNCMEERNLLHWLYYSVTWNIMSN